MWNKTWRLEKVVPIIWVSKRIKKWKQTWNWAWSRHFKIDCGIIRWEYIYEFKVWRRINIHFHYEITKGKFKYKWNSSIRRHQLRCKMRYKEALFLMGTQRVTGIIYKILIWLKLKSKRVKFWRRWRKQRIWIVNG